MKKKLSFLGFYLKLQLRTKLSILALCLCVLQVSATISTKSNLIVRVSGVQQTSISGVITDDNGPLPGVSVSVEGTQTGTISDMDGKYTINVPASAVLVFAYTGYETQKVQVQGQNTIDIKMVLSAEVKEEVVVVGYGVIRKEAVTGSVATMKGDDVRDVPSGNITQALQGRLSGVDMEQNSTKPGTSMQIRIRGTRSLNASNDPLVVLDGIPFAGSIGDINPSDIKSVDILKDASATAIYGSRGANGVILVTTTKGQKGQKSKITYNGYNGWKKIFAKYPMMNGQQFLDLRTAAGIYANPGVDEDNTFNTDWQDLFYNKTAIVTSHDLGISGGTEKGNYNFGAGYFRDQSLMPGQNYNRFSMRGSLELEIGKLFRVGFTTNNSYSITNGSNLGLYGVLSMSPLANPYNADGTWKRSIQMPLDNQYTMTRDIINNLGDSWKDQSKGYGSYNTFYGEVKIPGVEGLKYKINIGANMRMTNAGTYTGTGVFSNNAATIADANITNSLTTNWAVENMLTYDRTFAEKHQVNAVVLYSAEQTKYTSSFVDAKDFPTDAFQFYNLGQASGSFTIDPNNQSYQVSGLMSYMGRVMYSYDNRYMLSVTYRSDASSRLAEGHKWHSYPAVSVGWNIKNESFMKNVSLINSLKLRVGYGETSNQSIAPYATLGLLSTRPYNFGTATSTGLYVSTLPNPNLGWEFSKTWNYGLDFSILKGGRLSGTIEYYVTNTKDLLLSVNLPPTSGVGSYTGNIGESENKGMELSLNGVILDNLNGWTWEAGINLYANRNKLTKLASGATRDESNWWFVGHPIDVVFDYQKTGLWQQDDQFLTTYEPGGNVGMIKVKYTGDYNADGSPTRQIGPADRQIIDLEPNFQGGFNTRVAYKGFDLSIIGAFKNGGTVISNLYGSASYLNLMSGRRGNVNVDYWTTDNTGAKYPKPGGIMSGDNPKYGSTLSYFDGSYLKVRTISLGYNFDQKLTSKAGIEKLRIYCTVANPFVMFSPYNKESGMDPETNAYANDGSASAVPLSYNLRRLLTIGTNAPTTRNYLIGINLTF